MAWRREVDRSAIDLDVDGKNSTISTNDRIKVTAPEISFDLAGRHSVFAPFEYAN